MNPQLAAAAGAALSALGLAAALVAAIAARAPLAGLPMMLDLWTAAGLVRLAGAPAWCSLAAAAALVAVRRLVTRGLARRAPRAG